MCGIFGSKDLKQYTSLYVKNRKRGDFAFGGLFMAKKIHAIIKAPGIAKLNKGLQFEYGKNKRRSFADFDYYLGHTQAPTSKKRTFTHATSHPFSCDGWVVAHNGVISNHLALKKLIKSSKTYNEVDTSVIPALIAQTHQSIKNEIKSICMALEKLEGTFGLWIFNEKSHNTYLARSGSTVFADFITNDFSSTKIKGFTALDEGYLYLLTSEGVTSVGSFRPNSPFFV